MSLQDRDYYKTGFYRVEIGKKENQENKSYSDNSFYRDGFIGLCWLALVFIALVLLIDKGMETRDSYKRFDRMKYSDQIQPESRTVIINQIITPQVQEPRENVKYIDRQGWLEEAPKTGEQRLPQGTSAKAVYAGQRENGLSNAEDNHRIIQTMNERERLCRYWHTIGVGYEVETVEANIRQYCR